MTIYASLCVGWVFGHADLVISPIHRSQVVSHFIILHYRGEGLILECDKTRILLKWWFKEIQTEKHHCLTYFIHNWGPLHNNQGEGF